MHSNDTLLQGSAVQEKVESVLQAVLYQYSDFRIIFMSYILLLGCHMKKTWVASLFRVKEGNLKRGH